MSELIIAEEEIKAEHSALERRAMELAQNIRTEEDYNIAGEFLVGLKTAMKAWDEKINPVVKAARIARDKALALKNEIRLPLKRAELKIKPALAQYNERKEQERRREQERINAQLRAEAQARQRAAEEERRKTEIILPEGVKREEKPPIPLPEVPQVILPKSAVPRGIFHFDYYSAEVTDLVALMQAVIEGKAPAEAVQPNMSFLNKRASVLKDMLKWPGVVVKRERRVGGRVV